MNLSVCDFAVTIAPHFLHGVEYSVVLISERLSDVSSKYTLNRCL